MDEVWNWNDGNPSAYARIYKGEYLPAYDEPDTRYIAHAEPLSWFETNHPDWLEFRCGARSIPERTAESDGDLAYITGNPYDIPLDMANPSVLSWIEKAVWGPLAASGAYQHLDFDNFAETQGGWTGGACGHYTKPGAWVSQYAGTTDDPNWRAFQTRLAATIQTWLHASYPHIAFAANLSWSDNYTTDELHLLRHLDVWFDEQGFTDSNNGGSRIKDYAWGNKVAAVEAVVSAGHGWQDINQEPVSFASTTRAERQWALGNYLLLKNNHSWIYICGEQQYGTALIAPEYAAARVGRPTDAYYANQGVYRRDFTSGLVFVNPSGTSRYTVSIRAATYKDLYGNVAGPTISLSPGSAIVLVHV